MVVTAPEVDVGSSGSVVEVVGLVGPFDIELVAVGADVVLHDAARRANKSSSPMRERIVGIPSLLAIAAIRIPGVDLESSGR